MKKSMNKGYGVVELVIVLAIFSVGYFVTANIVAKDLNVNYEETLYENKINTIETQAKMYAQNTESLFKDSASIYMTVEQLANLNAVQFDKEGKVTDPRNTGSDLNNLKVKITNKDNKIEAKVLS